MNINDVSHRLRTEPGIQNSELVKSGKKAARGKSNDDSVVKKSELLKRLTNTQNQRTEKIRQAQAKLVSGELLTRNAAENAADFILRDQ
jgi:hypothetical protein